MGEQYEQMEDGAMFTFKPEELNLYDLKTGQIVDRQIEGGLFYMACCECGLVHKVDIFRDKISGEIGVKFLQDAEKTQAWREQLEAESKGT